MEAKIKFDSDSENLSELIEEDDSNAVNEKVQGLSYPKSQFIKQKQDLDQDNIPKEESDEYSEVEETKT